MRRLLALLIAIFGIFGILAPTTALPDQPEAYSEGYSEDYSDDYEADFQPPLSRSDDNVQLAYEVDPSTFVHGCVNVCSGALILSGVGIKEEGADALPLTHIYNSKSTIISEMGMGTSTDYPNLITPLEIVDSKALEYRILVTEPSGGLIPYTTNQNFHLTLDKEVIHKGLTNTGGGEISGRNNLKNKKFVYTPSSKGSSSEWGTGEMHVTMGSGGKQHYTSFKLFNSNCFHLDQEIKPSGNILNLSYNPGNRINRIQLTNSQGKVLRWLNIERPADDHIIYKSRNSKQVHYYTSTSVAKHPEEKKPTIRYLTKVVPEDSPPTSFSWIKPKKSPVYVVNKVKKPDHRYLSVKYNSGVEVSELLAPTGKNSSPQSIYSFGYPTKNKHYTQVKDGLGRIKRYHFTNQLRLSSIEHRGKRDSPYRYELFSWGSKGENEGNLIKKSLGDGKKKTLFSTTYSYDSNGNVLQEQFHGNLTGKKSSKKEVFTKECTYYNNEFNLKSSEQEDGGPKILFYYLCNTDLLHKKLYQSESGINRREFYEYDENNFLIKKIVDDGIREDQLNLDGVQQQLVTSIEYFKNPTQPGFGLPKSITESYRDKETGNQKQLSKKVNTYYYRDLLDKTDVYDGENVYLYTLRYNYDSRARLIRDTNALGHETQYGYDENDNKTYECKLGSGVKTYYYYDYSNRLVKQEEQYDDGPSSFIKYKYDVMGQKTSECNEQGHETKYSYDSMGREKEIILPEVPIGPATSLSKPKIKKSYDIANNITEITDGNGNTTKFTHNARGQKTSITYPDKTVEKFQYNLNGTLAIKWEKNGTYTKYTYDAYKRPVKTETYSASNQLLKTTSNEYYGYNIISSTDERGQVTRYSYDGAGRKILEIQCDLNGQEDRRITSHYDSLGRLEKVRQWFGDGPNDCTTTGKFYDLLDRETGNYVEDGSGYACQMETYGYDINGNKRLVRNYNADGTYTETHTKYNYRNQPISQIDPLGNETTVSYNYAFKNAFNQKVLEKTITDPLGNHKTTIYDAYGRPEIVLNKNAYATQTSERLIRYDATENIVWTKESFIVSPNPEESTVLSHVINKWTYTPTGEVKKQIEAVGTAEQKTTSYSYNECGERKTITKPDGVTLNYTYDDFGRVATLISSDNTISYAYTYDLNDRPWQRIDYVQGNTNTITYNDYGEMAHQTLGNNLTADYEYDRVGRRTSMKLHDGSGVRYVYDSVYLREISRVDEEGKEVYTHRYLAYDERGQVECAKLIGNAGEINYERDANNRCKTITSDYWEQHLTDYDACGNLLKYDIKDTMGELECNFAYDDLYQMKSESGVASHTFQTDSLNNRVSKDGKAHSVNALSQLQSDGEATYTYDLNGNLVQKSGGGKTIQYFYDALDRLVEIQEAGNLRLQFSFDPHNRRLRKQVSTWENNEWSLVSDLRFIHDDEDEIGATDQYNTVIEFRMLGLGKAAEIGAAVAIELDDKVYAPIHDHRGDLVTLVNPKRRVTVETYRYTAFGEEQIYDQYGTLHSESPVGNSWRFSSKRIDEESGLVFFGRRFYDPNIGRWITPDPAGFADGPNLYAYVHNAPLIGIDPYGLHTYSFFEEDYEHDLETGRPIVDDTWYHSLFDSPYHFVNEYYTDGLEGKHLNNVLPGVFNGMRTAGIQMPYMARNISENHGDRVAAWMYNYDNGIIGDLFQLAFNRLISARFSSAAINAAQMIKRFLDASPDNIFVLIAHSQGASIAEGVVARLGDKYLDRLHVITLGGAAMIEDPRLGSAINFIAEGDPIPNLAHAGSIALREMMGAERPIEHLKGLGPNSMSERHSFYGETYQEALHDHLDKIYKKYEVTQK